MPGLLLFLPLLSLILLAVLPLLWSPKLRLTADPFLNEIIAVMDKGYPEIDHHYHYGMEPELVPGMELVKVLGKHHPADPRASFLLSGLVKYKPDPTHKGTFRGEFLMPDALEESVRVGNADAAIYFELLRKLENSWRQEAAAMATFDYKVSGGEQKLRLLVKELHGSHEAALLDGFETVAPKEAMVHYWRGFLASEEGRYGLALQHLRRGNALPNCGNVRSFLGQALDDAALTGIPLGSPSITGALSGLDYFRSPWSPWLRKSARGLAKQTVKSGEADDLQTLRTALVRMCTMNDQWLYLDPLVDLQAKVAADWPKPLTAEQRTLLLADQQATLHCGQLSDQLGEERWQPRWSPINAVAEADPWQSEQAQCLRMALSSTDAFWQASRDYHVEFETKLQPLLKQIGELDYREVLAPGVGKVQ